MFHLCFFSLWFLSEFLRLAKGDSSCLTEKQALLDFRSTLQIHDGVVLGASQHELLNSVNSRTSSVGAGALLPLYPVWESLPSLPLMNVSNNSLAGTLNISSGRRRACRPSSSSKLVVLDLCFNRLSGPLREEVRWFQSLQELHLHHNRFSGELPRGVFQLTSLQLLDLSWNNFSGSISSDFQLLRSMKVLGLSHNNFSGLFPTSNFPRMTGLKLDVSANGLTSMETLPRSETSASSFQQLQTVDFSSNRPQALHSTATGARYPLEVADSGIPSQLGLSLVNLTTLDVCGNELHGALPETFAKLQQLEQLKVSNNQLSHMSDLATSLPSKLKVLSAGNNMFSGPLLVSKSPSLPTFKLEVLYLSENDFSGEIPSELGQLKHLKKLVLYPNNLNQGNIPASLASCELLEEIWINNNRLTDICPRKFSR